MSVYNSHLSQPPRSPGSESPSFASGAATPTGTTGSSGLLTSSVSGLWGGLVRRFSSEMTNQTSGSTSSSVGGHSSIHHSQTYPVSANGVDGVYTPPHTHRTASPMRPPPLEPLVLHGFRDDTGPDARLLTTAIAEEIRIMVPARLSIIDDWNLVYSLDQDGASLSTLYEKCRRYEGKRVAFVLVVKDCEGAIFGAYLSEYPRPAPSYFGNGECFLWRASLAASLPPPPSADTTNLTRSTTIASPTPNTSQSTTSAASTAPSSFSLDPALLAAPTSSPNAGNGNGSLKPPPSPSHPPHPPPSPSIRFKAFPYSGINEYFMFCETHFLSVGGGDGRYGLWLDDSLDRGHSSTCMTFGNEPLSDEGEKFGILGVEIWVIGAGPQ